MSDGAGYMRPAEQPGGSKKCPRWSNVIKIHMTPTSYLYRNDFNAGS